MDLGTNQALVTGANGWLGRNLVETLIKGDQDCDNLRSPQKDLAIKCLVLPGEDVSFLKNLSDRIEIVSGDLRNTVDCSEFVANSESAIIFHTAGIIHPKNIREFYTINVGGIKNILNAAVNAKVKRIVAVSSNSPFGANPHPDHLFDELSPYNPYMNYGLSKMKMEKLVQESYDKGKIETAIIRPPWFYGPHQPERQILFFKMIKEGKVPVVGSGKNLRSMAYVSNICQGAILASISDRANGQSYWIADERPYSMAEIVDTVEKLLEEEFDLTCQHSRIFIPSFIGGIATLLDWSIQKAGLYNQKVHVLSEMNKTIACDIRKAKLEIGYNPTIELVEGMRRSISSILTSTNILKN